MQIGQKEFQKMLAEETGTKVGKVTGCPRFELSEFSQLVKKISNKAMMDIGKKVEKSLSCSLLFSPCAFFFLSLSRWLSLLSLGEDRSHDHVLDCYFFKEKSD